MKHHEIVSPGEFFCDRCHVGDSSRNGEHREQRDDGKSSTGWLGRQEKSSVTYSKQQQARKDDDEHEIGETCLHADLAIAQTQQQQQR